MTPTTLALLLSLAPAQAPGCAPCATPMSMPMAMLPAPAGMPFPQPCPPSGPPAPVLPVKVMLPVGVSVGVNLNIQNTMYGGGNTFGLRPGYRYRFVLDGVATAPNKKLYPTVDVVGSLVPRNNLNYWEFPAALAFSEAELKKASTGTLITKVIYLEDPTKAVPAISKADAPIELSETTAEEALKVAMENGRVVAIIKLGDRAPDGMELQSAAVANTVLFPGAKGLAAPSAPPMLGWQGVALFDPVLGPKHPVEECITDGSDKGTILGIGPNGRANGLNPTDVGVEYTLRGQRKVATSNEVCICSPRFVVRMAELSTNSMKAMRHLDESKNAIVKVAHDQRLGSQAVITGDRLALVGTDLRPGVVRVNDAPASFMSTARPVLVANSNGSLIVISAKGPDELTSHPDQLVVTKTVSPTGAVKVGEEVTFTISFVNRTKNPISDVIVSDSLSGRLEYITGSAKSDRPANVTAGANEAGSSVVRFEIPGTIQPGQTGQVQFKARVR